MSAKPIEYVSKILTSFTYRLTLLAVGLAIVVIEDNVFHWGVYLAAMLGFAVAAVGFRVARPDNSFIRLLADYAFIVLVLYDKGLDTFINSCFIIIPIVNSVNHTSPIKTSSSVWRLYVACLVAMLLISHLHPKASWVLALGAFGVISLLTKIREWITRMDNSALTSISEYHGENVRLGNSHLLLQKIIDNWQGNRLLTAFCGTPVNIVVFKKTANRFRIISGATFVKNFAFLDEPGVYAALEQNSILYNADVLVDNAAPQPNVCLQLAGQVSTYLFYLEFSKPVSKANMFDSYLVSVFNRGLFFVVKVLDNEGVMVNDRNNLMRRMKNRITLMDRTINVVHFINNRLSPIINYFEMNQFYQQEAGKTESQAFLTELGELIDKEQRRAKDSLRQIDTRSKTLLHRATEMRLEDASVDLKLKQLVRTVREAWEAHDFTHDTMRVEWFEATMERTVAMDANGLWLVFEEIATNLAKYGRGQSAVTFFEDELAPGVSFRNNLDAGSNVVHSKKTRALIEQFNNNDLNEIMRRNSIGLHMIKTFCNKSRLGARIALTSHSFSLTLTFPHLS